MKENTLSYTTRIGKTTFIVNVKQSESAKKPLNTVFQEICRHEMLGDFSADKYLNLENLQKSSWQTRSRRNHLQLCGYAYEIGINEMVIDTIDDYITKIEIPVLIEI